MITKRVIGFFLLAAMIFIPLNAQKAFGYDPQEIDQNLEKFAGAIGAGGGGYRWPSQFQKIVFNTKNAGSSGELESEATMYLSDWNDQTMNVCYLLAGQVYGVALTQNVPIKEAIATIRTSDEAYFIKLPLPECKAMGNAILADPFSNEALKDSIFFFTAKVAGIFPQRKP